MAGAEWVIIHGPVISSTNSSVLLLRSALLSLLQCYCCKHGWEIVVILWRWVGFKFSKLSPSSLRAKMKWLSLWCYFKRGKSLLLFLNISRAFCYITRVVFLSCPTLICNSLWVMSQCLISGWDLRLWYTVQSLSLFKILQVFGSALGVPGEFWGWWAAVVVTVRRARGCPKLGIASSAGLSTGHRWAHQPPVDTAGKTYLKKGQKMLDRKRMRGESVTNSRGKQWSERKEEGEKKMVSGTLADTLAWGEPPCYRHFFFLRNSRLWEEDGLEQGRRGRGGREEPLCIMPMCCSGGGGWRSEIESGRERRKAVALMLVCVSLDNKLKEFSSVKSVLPVKVISKRYLCLHLHPQALSSYFLPISCWRGVSKQLGGHLAVCWGFFST